MQIIFIFLSDKIVKIEIHLGKNPNNGGNPPKEKNRIIILTLFFIWIIYFVEFLFKIEIICQIIIE
jgi:hypothetical protein